jgi:hypothetical protein
MDINNNNKFISYLLLRNNKYKELIYTKQPCPIFKNLYVKPKNHTANYVEKIYNVKKCAYSPTLEHVKTMNLIPTKSKDIPVQCVNQKDTPDLLLEDYNRNVVLIMTKLKNEC